MLPLMRIKPELSHFRVNTLGDPSVGLSERSCADARTGRDSLCAQKVELDRVKAVFAGRLALYSRPESLRRRSLGLCEGSGGAGYLDEAEWLVAEVNRVLGRPRGIRIGEEPDRDGQYFHYLAMWLYALAVLGRHRPRLSRRGRRSRALKSMTGFVLPGRGVIWKMQEDLSGPYPGYGLGALDAFDGYVSYRLLDERELAREIAEMHALIEADGPGISSLPRISASA